MSVKVFISYSHTQADWVRDRLAPAVRASGAEVILDVVDGVPGWSLDVQMKKWADEAAHVLAVLSPEYFASTACKLEWARAMGHDPGFLQGGLLVPLLRKTVDPLPAELLGTTSPLYLDLRQDAQNKADATLEATWSKLLSVWCGDLGLTPVTKWLDALRDIVRDLKENKHVSLVASERVKWRALLDEVNRQLSPDAMAFVDVGSPVNWERPNFLENTLAALGVTATLDRSGPRSDIVGFSKRVSSFTARRLAFKNLQRIKEYPDFGADFFDAFRYHAMDDGRNLTLLVHTTEPFGGLLPKGHLLSMMTATIIFLG
jgi:hypothetical protein